MTTNCNFNAIPLAQSQPVNTPSLFNLNYTNQDFWSMKQRLVLFIQQQFPNDFNDFVESSLAIMLIENWAFLADTLSFKIDQIANELFIDTVTEIDNAFRLANLVGFQPTPPIAAAAGFSATLGNLLSVDMVIPTPVQLSVTSNQTPMTYELFPQDANGNPLYDDDIVIPAGAFSNTAIVGVEGTTVVQQFQATGQANQSVRLTQSPVIYDTIQVTVNGTQWNQVAAFTASKQYLEFIVQYDSTYNAFLIFGDNYAGLIPPNGSTIQATYRVGGGSYGNIVSGSVNTSLPYPVPGFDITIPVAFTNYTAGQFGYDGDTIDDIREKLPAYLNSQNRLVTGTDFKTMSEQFVTATNGQIGKATAVLRNYGCAGNIIDLFILSLNGPNALQTSTDGMKSALADAISQLKMMTDYVCIKDGQIILVDVVIELTVNSFYKKFQSEITANATNVTNQFFALSNWDYGDTLRANDLVQALGQVPEVESTTVTFNTVDPNNSGSIVISGYYEIIQLDTLTIQITYE